MLNLKAKNLFHREIYPKETLFKNQGQKSYNKLTANTMSLEICPIWLEKKTKTFSSE